MLLGTAVRAAYAFPVHKLATDADSLKTGLRAFAIQGGDLVVFYSNVRIGALESYFHAVAFALLGPTRAAISIAPLLAGSLVLVVFFLFVRELFSSEVALASLPFLAFPSPSFLAWTYMPNGYPETVLFCVTTLWLAARIARQPSERWTGLALGLSVGLGWWNSLLTLCCSGPALAWLFLLHGDRLRRGRLALHVLAGFVFGAAPWIYFNIRYPLATFGANFGPPGGGRVLSTARRLLAEIFPDLLVGLNPLGPRRPPAPAEAALQTPAGALELLALLLLPFAPRLWGRRLVGNGKAVLLVGLVALAVAGLFVFSEPGQVLDPTVRYVLPFFFVVATSLGLLVAGVAQRSRSAAGLVASVVLVFNLSGYYWPGTSERKLWERNARHDDRLLAFLDAERVRWVCGNYWLVYPLNFLSRERIRGVPYQRHFDFYEYGKRLPADAGKVALLTSTPEELRGWTERAGLTGRVVEVAPGYYFAFLPDVNPPRGRSSQELLAILARSAPAE